MFVGGFNAWMVQHPERRMAAGLLGVCQGQEGLVPPTWGSSVTPGKLFLNWNGVLGAFWHMKKITSRKVISFEMQQREETKRPRLFGEKCIVELKKEWKEREKHLWTFWNWRPLEPPEDPLPTRLFFLCGFVTTGRRYLLIESLVMWVFFEDEQEHLVICGVFVGKFPIPGGVNLIQLCESVF